MRRLFNLSRVLLPVLCLLCASPALAEDTLPSVFDIRTVSGPLTVKNQGASDTCWAAAASTVWEGLAVTPAGVVYSQDHLVQDAFSDGNETEGGNYRTIMAYLAGGRGPVVEVAETGQSVPGQSDPAVNWQVRSVYLLSAQSPQEVKEALQSDGPLQASVYLKREELAAGAYYNEETAALFDPDHTTANHDVVILGWDDTYPADAFKRKPSRNGAWICQNSWGESFGKNGIFYVSYEDPCITSRILVYRLEQKNTSEKLYQQDYRGWQGRQGFADENCYFACVYETEQSERLRAVGFYATGDQTAYEVYLVHDAQDMASLQKRILLGSGVLEKTGYYRIDLTDDLNATERLLAGGERFGVVVRIHTPGSDLPVAVEMKKKAGPWKIDLEGKESYLSMDGTVWENTQLLYGTNVCLKCYTVPAGEAGEEQSTEE